MDNKLAGFLQESDGSNSCMRLVLLLGVGIILGVWAFLSAKSGEMKPIDSNLTMIIVALLSAKCVQKKFEVASEITAAKV